MMNQKSMNILKKMLLLCCMIFASDAVFEESIKGMYIQLEAMKKDWEEAVKQASQGEDVSLHTDERIFNGFIAQAEDDYNAQKHAINAFPAAERESRMNALNQEYAHIAKVKNIMEEKKSEYANALKTMKQNDLISKL